MTSPTDPAPDWPPSAGPPPEDISAPDNTSGSTGPWRPPWYRRRAVLVAAGVAAVVLASVLVDLPHHTSRQQEVADETTVIGEINSDLSPCTYAAGESFSIYADEVAKSVTASEASTVPGLLSQDQEACSFTNSSMFDLANIEVPGSAAGRVIGDMVITVTDWATSDAVGAIQQIEVLSSNPADAVAKRSLARYEKALAADRAKAMSELSQADSILDAHLPAPALPNLPG